VTTASVVDERLNELEVRMAFIEDALNGLANADVEQSQRLAALERAVRELRGELASMRTGDGHDPHSEPPPPHY
jgi:SlyX protein